LSPNCNGLNNGLAGVVVVPFAAADLCTANNSKRLWALQIKQISRNADPFQASQPVTAAFWCKELLAFVQVAGEGSVNECVPLPAICHQRNKKKMNCLDSIQA
jgi:hypothetical protein